MLCGFAGEGVRLRWWWVGVDSVASGVSPVCDSSYVFLRGILLFRDLYQASEIDM